MKKSNNKNENSVTSQTARVWEFSASLTPQAVQPQPSAFWKETRHLI